MSLPLSIYRARRLAWHGGELSMGERSVPEETAVAFTYNRLTQAVMMATPADLEDFAIGFSLTEGVVAAPEEIEALDIVPTALGIELRMDVAPRAAHVAAERRRTAAGPVGCGLCGMESLEQAMRAVPHVVTNHKFPAQSVAAAVAALPAHQKLNHDTRAVHAAAYWEPNAGLLALREDVGRHNALDKLAGALARGSKRADDGIVVLTSRLSVELVQKAAAMGVSVLVGVSAVTALALRVAEEANITLIGIARDDGFEIFAHAERIEAVQHVA
ncbi:MAG: formate dehydrogenase accessory sulfurtransferase FdhD [Alphaproteobacteria bacterium]|nr:formate dehydrogenase accessory sulfurtransferase FdhD [Alphaproteobacteria bacterium]